MPEVNSGMFYGGDDNDEAASLIVGGLGSLDFTDLYIRIDTNDFYDPFTGEPTAWYSSSGSSEQGVRPVPEAFFQDIDILRHDIRDHYHSSTDFALTKSGMRLRGNRREVAGDGVWVALRRFPVSPLPLNQLGFLPQVIRKYREWGTRTGLIVVGGSTRAGKTTTASACLKDWLETYGRVAITIEDPIEYSLKGKIGKGGYCFQFEVKADSEWADALKAALRWAPRYIFLGEVRTPAAARNLLRAATSGHLALCTVHGGSIEETLSALHQIASSELGETTWPLLGDGLCAVIHQRLIDGKRPEVQLLEADTAVRQLVRSGRLHQLGTMIAQQMAVLASAGDVGKSMSTTVAGPVAVPKDRERLQGQSVQSLDRRMPKKAERKFFGLWTTKG